MNVVFTDHLYTEGLADTVFNALKRNETDEVVLKLLHIVRDRKLTPTVKGVRKSALQSAEYRAEGNQAFAVKNYGTALELYNMALQFAPDKSRAMLLAYSNRCAVLLKATCYNECLKDLDTCYAMNCTLEIMEKLKRRKYEAEFGKHIQKPYEKSMDVSGDFFKIHFDNHPIIPAASDKVAIIVNSKKPKVIAATDISVGTIIAYEKAYVATTPKNYLYCHHCLKQDLNLIPCDGCNVAMFCTEDCRKQCMEEYHDIECQILYDQELLNAVPWLAVKAVIKIFKSCQSWAEFIAISQNLGDNENSTVNEIFNSNNMMSLLSVMNEPHFVHGKTMNHAIGCAMLVHCFDEISTFFPRNAEEKHQAMRAFAKVLMFLCINNTIVQILSVTSVVPTSSLVFQSTPHFGWFSFIGKMKHSCNPNTLVLGLNSKILMVALKPMEPGTEITYAYSGHWLDIELPPIIRRESMLTYFAMVCDCFLCTGGKKPKQILNQEQKKSFHNLNVKNMIRMVDFSPDYSPTMYTQICNFMTAIGDLPYADEYPPLYEVFRRCLMFKQCFLTNNLSAGNDRKLLYRFKNPLINYH